MKIKIFIIILLTSHSMHLLGQRKISKVEKVAKLETKILKLEKQICLMESGNTTNTYTKIYLRNLKMLFLKNSFELALLLELFDNAEEILKELGKTIEKSKINNFRKKLKIAKMRAEKQKNFTFKRLTQRYF